MLDEEDLTQRPVPSTPSVETPADATEPDGAEAQAKAADRAWLAEASRAADDAMQDMEAAFNDGRLIDMRDLTAEEMVARLIS